MLKIKKKIQMILDSHANTACLEVFIIVRMLLKFTLDLVIETLQSKTRFRRCLSDIHVFTVEKCSQGVPIEKLTLLVVKDTFMEDNH